MKKLACRRGPATLQTSSSTRHHELVHVSRKS